MNVAVSSNTVSSPPIVMASCDVVSSTLDTSMQVAVESNLPEVTIQDSEMNLMDVRLSAGHLDVDQWSAEKGRRFRALTLREAIGELSIEELAELELLTQLRRSKKYPRSADEILWQRGQRSVTRDLLHALQKYVNFHDTPRNS